MMKALQDALPEDVRDKLTTAVSGILHNQGTNLKINELLDIARISNVSSGLKSKIQDKVRGISNEEGLSQDHRSSDQTKRADDLLDNSVNSEPSMNIPSGGVDSGLHQFEKSQKPSNITQFQPVNNQGGDSSDSVTKETSDPGNSDNNGESFKDNDPANFDNIEKGSGAKPSSSSHADEAVGSEEANVGEHKDQNVRIAQLDTKEENNSKNEEKSVHDHNKMASPSITGDVSSSTGSFSEAQAQTVEREDHDNQRRDNKNIQPVPDQTKSNSDSNAPAFSVSEALDTLTGMDDSTQVAVNSVFGVIENMISQLEEGSDNENEVKDKKTDSGSDSISRSQHLIDNHRPENSEAISIDQSVQADRLSDPFVLKHNENSPDSPYRFIEKGPSQSSTSFNGNNMNSSQKSDKGKNGDKKNNELISSNLLVDNSDRLKKVTNVPPYITSNPYEGSLYNERVHGYLLSKIPTKPLDIDTTTAMLLDYLPEEGQWMLLEQPENIRSSAGGAATHGNVGRKMQPQTPAKAVDEVIEPSYVILNTEPQQEPVEEYESIDNGKEDIEINDNRSEEFMSFVKSVILNSLKVEVGRRRSTVDMKEMEANLAREMEQVANAASLSIRLDKEQTQFSEVKYHSTDSKEKLGTLDGENIVSVISSAVQETSYLREVLPVGVIIGSSLAALRKHFIVATVHYQNADEAKVSGEVDPGNVNFIETQKLPVEKLSQNGGLNSSVIREGQETKLKTLNNETVMVGAVTAALGASAFLVQQQVIVTLFRSLVLFFLPLESIIPSRMKL